jgi:hypothetical protein
LFRRFSDQVFASVTIFVCCYAAFVADFGLNIRLAKCRLFAIQFVANQLLPLLPQSMQLFNQRYGPDLFNHHEEEKNENDSDFYFYRM